MWMISLVPRVVRTDVNVLEANNAGGLEIPSRANGKDNVKGITGPKVVVKGLEELAQSLEAKM